MQNSVTTRRKITYQKYYFPSCKESDFKWFHLSLSSAPCFIGWILFIKMNFKPADNFYLQGFDEMQCLGLSPLLHSWQPFQRNKCFSLMLLWNCMEWLWPSKRETHSSQIPPAFPTGLGAGQTLSIKVSHSTLHHKSLFSLLLHLLKTSLANL